MNLYLGFRTIMLPPSNREMSPGIVGADLWCGNTLDPVVTRRPRFEWTATAGASWYNLVLRSGSTVYADEWTRVANWQPAANLPTGAYQWWVRTYDPATAIYGVWSTGAAFQMASPAMPWPIAPVGSVTSPVVFSWTQADGAFGYDLWYYPLGQYAERVTVHIDDGETTSYTPGTALSPGTYEWVVTASNSYSSLWGIGWEVFTVED